MLLNYDAANHPKRIVSHDVGIDRIVGIERWPHNNAKVIMSSGEHLLQPELIQLFSSAKIAVDKQSEAAREAYTSWLSSRKLPHLGKRLASMPTQPSCMLLQVFP
mmetsp:Transcript_32933/g.97196  ORF Transcript_32933/g.97196 Transcript_32933/m.97196 type:complete len:105 (+) Transcript_32933:639-953(+)